jgi:hypothetical protein
MGTIAVPKSISNDMSKQDSAERVRKFIIVCSIHSVFYSLRSVFYSQCILFTVYSIRSIFYSHQMILHVQDSRRIMLQLIDMCDMFGVLTYRLGAVYG